MQEYHDYFAKIKEDYSKERPTELTGRTALENLLNKIADKISPIPQVTHEAVAQDRSIPDFKIEHATAIIGYIEVKKIGMNLEEVLKSPQIKRYKELNDNILITDYGQWIWLKDDTIAGKITLFTFADSQNPRFRLDTDKINELHGFLIKFMSTSPSQIGDVKKLAEALAIRTRHLKDYMEEPQLFKSGGRLQGLYESFKEQLYSQLKPEEFADTYAQMLSYGLFLAKLNSDTTDPITLKNAGEFVPKPFELIKELMGFLGDLDNSEYAKIKWAVEDILFVINYMDRYAIVEQLSFEKRKKQKPISKHDKEEAKLFEKDPFIYFYEDFLKEYNAEEKKSRGVYYTPPPVVEFIVRSIDDILKDKFNISAGLAEPDRVTVLDFACGTGTFILEIFQQLLKPYEKKIASSGKAPNLVKEHLLKNIYGFELLIAAYTIAHLKLWQYLTDKKYKFKGKQRLQIFLTNTLDDISDAKPNFLLPALTEEAKKSNAVKDDEILVITGNPPYSGESQNLNKTDEGELKLIAELMRDYRTPEVKALGKRALKWLNDDYVKFIRYAQYKMQNAGEGVVGIITNHGFLDNPTFSGMRYSLMQTFDQIYVLDLHGNLRKSDKKPKDIDIDKNVFDIQTGVSISFFVKNKNLEKSVFHADIWGKRIDKFKWLANSKFADIEWEKLTPSSPYHLFIPMDSTLQPEYDRGVSIDGIFDAHAAGIVTAKDKLAIQFSKDEIKNAVRKLTAMGPEEAREFFGLRKSLKPHKISNAKKDVEDHGQDDKMFQPILYRPFDKRFTYYSGEDTGMLHRSSKDVMQHINKDNCALVTVHQNSSNTFNKAFMTNNLTELHMTTGDISHVLPLYTYPAKNKKTNTPELTNGDETLTGTEPRENFKIEFRNFINKKYEHKFSPEEIMAYIYAILNSPTYRNRYNEFLKRGYPRIPFCENKQDFINLAKIGQNLIDLHLMDKIRTPNLWKGEGNNFKIEKLEYNEKQKQLHINKQKYLEPVPKEIWEFEICGFQALKNYLKERENRELDLAELTHIERMIYAIQETITAMQAIDSLTSNIFPHWHESPPN